MKDLSETKPKLIEENSLYHAFFNLAPDPIIITDPDNGCIIDVNQAFAEWFHCSRDELIGRTTTELGFWADSESRNAVLERLYDTGCVDDVLTEHRRTNGELRQIMFSGKLVAVGKNKWLISVGRDITQRRRMEKTLQESEERFRAIANYTHDWESWIGSDGKLTWVNPAVEGFTGYSVKECLDMNEFPLYLIHEADRERMRRLISEALQGAIGSDVEFRVRCKDGSVKWASASWQRIYDDRGSYIGYRSSIRDITERKRVEEVIQYQNLLFSTQQEASIDGILVVDDQGTILSYNSRFVDIWGIAPEVLETRSDKLFLQAIVGNLANAMEFYQKVNSLYENQWEISRDEIALVDGRVLERYSSPVVGYEKRYYGRIWYFRDISDRKRAEEALRESREVLSSLINATNEGLLLTDVEGTILVANEVLAQRLGKSILELIGTSLYDHFPTEVDRRRRKQYDKVISTGKPIHFEDERAGRFFEVFVYPVFSEEGKVSKMATFAQDITKRKRTEEERERLIAELKEALSKIKTLSGFLPICSSCKKIRNDEGYWEQIEVYIRDNSDAEFSHGICPECAAKLYPEYFRKK